MVNYRAGVTRVAFTVRAETASGRAADNAQKKRPEAKVPRPVRVAPAISLWRGEVSAGWADPPWLIEKKTTLTALEIGELVGSGPDAVVVNLRVVPVGSGFFVNGDAAASVAARCPQCGSSFSSEVSSSFETWLTDDIENIVGDDFAQPRGSGGRGRRGGSGKGGGTPAAGERRRGASSQAALSAEADALHFPRGAGSVDLSALVRDALLLSVPVAPMCGEVACRSAAGGPVGVGASAGAKNIVARIDVGPSAAGGAFDGLTGGSGESSSGAAAAGTGGLTSGKKKQAAAPPPAAVNAGPWAALAALRDKMPQ